MWFCQLIDLSKTDSFLLPCWIADVFFVCPALFLHSPWMICVSNRGLPAACLVVAANLANNPLVWKYVIFGTPRVVSCLSHTSIFDQSNLGLRFFLTLSFLFPVASILLYIILRVCIYNSSSCQRLGHFRNKSRARHETFTFRPCVVWMEILRRVNRTTNFLTPLDSSLSHSCLFVTSPWETIRAMSYTSQVRTTRLHQQPFLKP